MPIPLTALPPLTPLTVQDCFGLIWPQWFTHIHAHTCALEMSHCLRMSIWPHINMSCGWLHLSHSALMINEMQWRLRGCWFFYICILCWRDSLSNLFVTVGGRVMTKQFCAAAVATQSTSDGCGRAIWIKSLNWLYFSAVTSICSPFCGKLSAPHTVSLLCGQNANTGWFRWEDLWSKSCAVLSVNEAQTDDRTN